MPIPQINSNIPLWKQILRNNFSRIDKLADFLELNSGQRSQILQRPDFPLHVPIRLARKMAKGTLDDPITRQFLPTSDELIDNPNFILDPVCDFSFQKEGKLLKKYEGRVLLVCTGACAMHCRYCFRQHFPYESTREFDEELTLIGQDTSIHEVILSGGDPLSLSDELLGALLDRLSGMQHIKRIRFHTRFPIGIPERIDDNFLKVLAKVPQQIYFIIHCNHPKELDQDIFERLKEVQKLGIPVLNQAVLLKGVNDDVATLKELSQCIADNGILFYYLHQLDKVKGSAHFEVDEARGRYLVGEIAKQMPGYAVPKYVREVAGDFNKTLL